MLFSPKRAMLRGKPMNIVFALAMVLINVPRRPGRTFNTFANTIATMYAIATPPIGYIRLLPRDSNSLRERYFNTEENMEAGRAISVIRREMFLGNSSPNHLLCCSTYPKAIIRMITSTLCILWNNILMAFLNLYPIRTLDTTSQP